MTKRTGIPPKLKSMARIKLISTLGGRRPLTMQKAARLISDVRRNGRKSAK